MYSNVNVRKSKVHLQHVETKRQEIAIPREVLEKAKQAREEQLEPELSADHLAIIYVCQRGQQDLLSIMRGVNATRVPIGKEPIDNQAVLSLLNELEAQGYLVKGELLDQPVWTTTDKAKELES